MKFIMAILLGLILLTPVTSAEANKEQPWKTQCKEDEITDVKFCIIYFDVGEIYRNYFLYVQITENADDEGIVGFNHGSPNLNLRFTLRIDKASPYECEKFCHSENIVNNLKEGKQAVVRDYNGTTYKINLATFGKKLDEAKKWLNNNKNINSTK